MRPIIVYCVVDPEHDPLLDTVGDTKKKALHKFDMLQPLPWPQAEKQGFRVKRFEMKGVIKNS